MSRETGIYKVTGGRTFRGHKPGATFTAALDRSAEARAVMRGDIRLLERVTPSIQPGTYTLPPGWLQQEEVQQ